MHLRPVACLMGALVGTLSAQTTLNVGPGALPEIRDALAVANPGDVILVQPGTYGQFGAAVGVTIRAAMPGTVSIVWQPQFVSPACLANPQCLAGEGPTWFAPPPGQTVHVVGIDFLPNTYTGVATVRHCVAVLSGTVTFDQCSVQANGTTALWVLNAVVHLQDCAVAGTGSAGTAHGAVAVNALITGLDTAFGGNSSPTPGDALILQTSTLHGSNLQMFGGSVPQGGVGGAALRGSSLSNVWIGDSTIVATGQCPVIANGASGGIERTTLLPSSGCASLPPVPVLSVARALPPQGGNLFVLHFQSSPGELVLVLCSPDLGVTSVPGVVDQPLTLGLVNFWSAGLFLTDFTGAANPTWILPSGAAFVGRPLWFQGAAGVGLPLHLSPVTGGIVR